MSKISTKKGDFAKMVENPAGDISDDFVTVAEAAKKWQISERSVRNYCEEGRIPGAKREGAKWLFPSGVKKPERLNKIDPPSLLEILRREEDRRMKGGIYHKVQIDLTYNSNHIEGSTLTHEQTRFIFETNTIFPGGEFEGIKVDDIMETVNHFRCVDHMIENARRALSENMIKSLHYILKNGTSDELHDWFNVGDYKKLPNEVGGLPTAKPEDVAEEMGKLIDWYEGLETHDFDDILEFHHRFEKIHPFQDGNGRVGRLIMFKECLRFGIVPFIITEKLKMFYYRGLKNWPKERGYLRDTCLSAQDEFKKMLDYFEVEY